MALDSILAMVEDFVSNNLGGVVDFIGFIGVSYFVILVSFYYYYFSTLEGLELSTSLLIIYFPIFSPASYIYLLFLFEET